jgi:hypothetical protein
MLATLFVVREKLISVRPFFGLARHLSFQSKIAICRPADWGGGGLQHLRVTYG